jgi:hypothetical protein
MADFTITYIRRIVRRAWNFAPAPRLRSWNSKGDNQMPLSTILIVLLILLLIGALPTWPYSASWGYAPGGTLGTVLVVVLILALLGRI